jgi:glycosyltransferase involved in cell wall biosynthesis
MRVLVLLSSLYTGGAEFSTLTFYGWLRSKGYDVKVVCYKKAKVEYEPKDFNLDDVTVLPNEGFRGKWKAINSIVRDYKPDVVHSVLFEANILGRFCKFSNPGIFHLESLVNEVYSGERLNDPHVTALKLKAYQVFDFITQAKGVDHYHANGKSVAAHYMKKLKISAKRITVIPRGRQTNPYVGSSETRQIVRQRFGIDEKTILLIAVGRHEYQKGHDILLHALNRLDKGEKYKCLIVGREGSRTLSLQETIKSFGLEKNVALTGHRSDVQEILAAADVFLFPSRFEGLPGALIEAESAGLAIVCSDIPNNKEVVVENENALLFPLESPEWFAGCLKELMSDPAKREEMQASSLRIFKERFQIGSVHCRMKEMIETLVRKKK